MQLLRAGLDDSDTTIPITEPITPGQWTEVMKIAVKQGILAITHDALPKMSPEQQPPRELRIRWSVNTELTERESARKQQALEQLTAFYVAHDIPVMLLKGAGLSSLYPHPAHRPYGDIDIWLYGEQPRADELVRRELGITVHNDVHHHTVFSFQGVMIENHFDFLNLWSHRSNRKLEHELLRYAKEPGMMLQVGEQRINLPSPNLNALFLMRHMGIHFAAVEIGLRHIADWAMFLHSDGDKVDWPTIQTVYKEQNMQRFADAVTAICVSRLGIKPPAGYSFENDLKLQEIILDEVLDPAFAEQHPAGGFFHSVFFKIRRWWANRWKHQLVYKDTLTGSFLWLCWAHVIRPKTITK